MPTVQEQDNQKLARRAHCVSSLYAFGLSIVIAATFQTFRTGFPQAYTLQIFEAVGFSVLFLFIPETLRNLMNKRIASTAASFNNEALVIAAVLCGTMIIGAVTKGNTALIIFAPLAALTTCFGLVPNLVSLLKTKMILPALCSFILLSIWSASFLLSSEWRGTPLFIEALPTNATFLWPIDTLFHTSIANMIRTYGVPSIGLNGIPVLRYHTGSHWIMAQWSNLLDISTLDSYLVIFPIVVFPLFIKALLTAAIEVMQYQNNGMAHFQSRSFWFVLTAGFIAFPDYMVHHIWKIDYPFNSESFTWSMLLVFLFSAGITSFLTTKKPHMLTNLEALSLVVLASIGAAAILVVKISTGAVTAPIFLYLFIRSKLYRFWSCTLVALLVSLLSIYLLSNAAPHGGSLIVSPFAYVTMHVSKNWRPFYYIVNYAWFWLLLYSEIQRNQWRTIDDFKNAFAGRLTYPIEIAFFIAIIGMFPGLVLTLNGDEFFFSTIHQWVCVCLLTGLGAHFTKCASLKGRVIRQAVMGMLILMLIANTIVLAKNCITMNVKIRTEISRQSAGQHDSNFQRKVTCISLLQKIGRMSLSAKSSTLLYVPYSNFEYWNMLRCAQSPFLGPALTGLAMLDGMPNILCNCKNDTYSDFGYETYAPRSDGFHSDTQAELLMRAKSLGFSQTVSLPASSFPVNQN